MNLYSQINHTLQWYREVTYTNTTVGAHRVKDPFSIQNICLSTGPTSAVGALRFIEPFSIHNICLSVCRYLASAIGLK
jgi:hypothetical protein